MVHLLPIPRQLQVHPRNEPRARRWDEIATSDLCCYQDRYPSHAPTCAKSPLDQFRRSPRGSRAVTNNWPGLRNWQRTSHRVMGPPVFALPVAIPDAAEVGRDHYASEPGGAGGRGLLLGILLRGGHCLTTRMFSTFGLGGQKADFFENGQFKKKNNGKTRKREEKKTFHERGNCRLEILEAFRSRFF